MDYDENSLIFTKKKKISFRDKSKNVRKRAFSLDKGKCEGIESVSIWTLNQSGSKLVYDEIWDLKQRYRYETKYKENEIKVCAVEMNVLEVWIKCSRIGVCKLV